MDAADPPPPSLRHRLHTVIFEADTPAGKAFDVALLIAILASVAAVMLESVASIRAEYGPLLRAAEWVLTIAFTLEYLLRLYSVERPLRYARSFYGIVDLLAVLPSYLSLLFPGAHSLLVVRALRLLRIFRVFKLGHFVSEGNVLTQALINSRRKILVFLGGVLTLTLILGTLMYMVEADSGGGFTSIPQSVYWAIVTLTTVGYGDIAPVTVAGKLLASVVMVVGYGIIAVPTGIVGVEIHKAALGAAHPPVSTQACPACGIGRHAHDARYCYRCGAWLHPEQARP